MLFELLAIVLLILLNGVLAGAEIATISIRKTRLTELVDSGKRSAVAVAKLRSNPESFLATVQVGITVVGATAAAFGGASVAEDLVPLISRWAPVAPHAEKIALGLVVVAVSFLSLVLGELVPKSLALRAAESYALLTARPLLGLATVARPVVAFLTGCSNLVLRIFGDRTTFTEVRLSRDEILQIVEEASTIGSVDPASGAIATRALEFSKLDAYMVMVPRQDVISLSREATWQEVAQVAEESGHSRVPVYDAVPERIIGFVNLRESLARVVLDPEARFDSTLHPIAFVPDSITAPALLGKMQKEQAQIVMVIDERGTIVGLVTIEDLVEELVGEILSENDQPVSEPVREQDGSWVLSASLPIHEVNRLLPVDLPEGPFATLAGLCLHLAGSIPKVGTTLQAPDGISLEILETTSHRIRRVRLRRGIKQNWEKDLG